MYLHEVMAAVFAGKIAMRGSQKDEFIFYLGPEDYEIKPVVAREIGITGCRLSPILARKMADGSITLLVPSQLDMTSDDWIVKEIKRSKK